MSATVLRVLNSEDTSQLKLKMLLAHINLPLFKESASFLIKSSALYLFAKRKDSCVLAYIPNQSFSLSLARTKSTIAAHFCTRLQPIVDRSYSHDTMLKVSVVHTILWSLHNKERLFIAQKLKRSFFEKQWRHTNFQNCVNMVIQKSIVRATLVMTARAYITV